jgi:ATP-binding cassette subfamily B protein
MVLAFCCLIMAKAFNIMARMRLLRARALAHLSLTLHAARCAAAQVPLALKAAVDDVSQGRVPYNSVLCYGFFRFLTDSSKECRDCLFNYSSTYASRKISLRVFNHVQSLSLRFHLNRKTGAVLRAVSRGSAAYADLLRYFTFQIAPIFLEVGLVSAYLFSRYSPAFGLITITVMTVYVASTIIITEWRNKYRRLATEADDAFNQKAVDSLLNFETVLYFCAQEHISDVYDER